MTRRRNTLGNRLARSIAVSTAICLVAFTAIAAVVWWSLESDEDVAEIAAEGPRGELIEQLVLAVAIAGPVGIATTMLAARWLARRATQRIDAVVATAANVTARDLSARLPVSDARDELDDLSVALNQMLARIDDGVAAQRQFAADASHELRTPLTAIRTGLEVTRSRPRSPEEWERAADQALVQLDRMSALIDALIQLARADAGTAARETVAIRDVIDRACEALAGAAARRNVRVVADAAPELTVVADPAGLEIALGNLIANAITHSPDGGEVAIAARRGDADAGIRIDVTDRGAGVPAGERQRIFQPFARGSAATADRVAAGAGVGLGLPIARRIAEAHGGGIEVGDAPGGGARFTLRL